MGVSLAIAIGEALTFQGAAALFVGSAILTGGAMVASRIINGSTSGSQNTAQAGARVQLPPATTNRVPVLYGRGFLNGIITDAYLTSTDNNATGNQMTYCLVYSEATNAVSSYTLNDVYWNDLKLTFDGTDPEKVLTGTKVVSVKQLTGESVDEVTTDDNFGKDDGYVRVWAYAGSGAAANQIHGPTTPVNAWDIPGLEWTSADRMEGLVFAIVQIRYKSEYGFTGLPNITLDIENNITNPADVFTDYMTTARYGAGFTSADLDTAALSDWADYCDELLPYIDKNGDTQTDKRFQINGVIDTNKSVKQNLDQLMANSSAWLSYNIQDGVWTVHPKQAGASVMTFDDSNIISGIQISGTRLDDLYNNYEAEYVDARIRDQRNYVRETYDPAQINTEEPDNTMRLTLEMVNNEMQARRVARVEINQARADLVINFTTSHQGLEANAGDIITVYNTEYGWCEPSWPDGKPFRIARIREIETAEGALQAEIQAIEYAEDAYADEPITQFQDPPNGSIPPERTQAVPVAGDGVQIINVDTTSLVPNFTVEVTLPSTGGPYTEIQVFYAEGPITIPGTSPPLSDYILLGAPHLPPPPSAFFELSARQSGIRCSAASGSNVITVTNGTTEYISRLLAYYSLISPVPDLFFDPSSDYTAGTFPALTTITAVTSDTTFTVSNNATANETGFGMFEMRGTSATAVQSGLYTITNISDLQKWGSINDLRPGQLITKTSGGGAFPANTSIVSIDSPTQITVDKAATATGSYTFRANPVPSIQEIVVTSLKSNAVGKQYFIRVRLKTNAGLLTDFSDVDPVTLLPPTVTPGSYTPNKSLNDLTDVTLTSVQPYDHLEYNSGTSQWINTANPTIKGDLTLLAPTSSSNAELTINGKITTVADPLVNNSGDLVVAGRTYLQNAQHWEGTPTVFASGNTLRLKSDTDIVFHTENKVNGTQPADILTSSWSGGTVTLGMELDNALGDINTGDYIQIAGMVPTGYNGIYTVTGHTFTYGVVNNITYALASNPGTLTTAGSLKRLTKVSGATWSAGTATLSLPLTEQVYEHSVGEYIIVSGITPSGYNGTYVITGRVNNGIVNTISYALASNPGTYTSGGRIEGFAIGTISTQSSNVFINTNDYGYGGNLTVGGTIQAPIIKDTGLTSGRVTYATTGGQLTDSSTLTFDGTTLTAPQVTVSGNITVTTGNITATAGNVGSTNGDVYSTNGDIVAVNGSLQSGFLYLIGSTSGSVGLQAAATTSDTLYTLPAAYPTANNQTLVSTTGGVMTWLAFTSEDVANGAAMSLSTQASYFSTGATGETATLAAGSTGQNKSLMMVADGGGDMVVTVSNAGWKTSGTGTITFNAIGDSCLLQYVNSKWFAVGVNSVTFA